MYCVLLPTRTVATVRKNCAVGIVDAIKVDTQPSFFLYITCVYSPLVFSVVFCVVRVVHNLDLRLVFSKWQPFRLIQADSVMCLRGVYGDVGDPTNAVEVESTAGMKCKLYCYLISDITALLSRKCDPPRLAYQ